MVTKKRFNRLINEFKNGNQCNPSWDFYRQLNKIKPSLDIDFYNTVIYKYEHFSEIILAASISFLKDEIKVIG